VNVVQYDVFWLDVVMIDVVIVEKLHRQRDLVEDVEERIL
jgi:hypothetical protein